MINEKTQVFYRVANIETQQGLWYDWEGQHTGLIHTTYNFCKSSDLPMPYDPNVSGWLSSTDSLENIWHWFPKKDIFDLQKEGWFLYAYLADSFKEYENHYLVDQKTSIPLLKFIIGDNLEIKTTEQVNQNQILKVA
jgi:hypothetical protein